MADLHLLSLTQIAAGLEAGDFSAVDVTESLLGRIDALVENHHDVRADFPLSIDYIFGGEKVF